MNDNVVVFVEKISLVYLNWCWSALLIMIPSVIVVAIIVTDDDGAYWKCSSPMTRSVRLLVGRSVGLNVIIS